jgi:hypothetical protein
MPPVVPMGLYSPGDAWNTVLRRYKDAPVRAAREHFSDLVAVQTEHFLALHADCVRFAMGRFDSYCVVPSSHIRRVSNAPHPLEKVLARVQGLKPLSVLRLVPATGEARHMHASHTAFRPADTPSVERHRVLVVDDSWVTGARALSAVRSLNVAGAEVAGVLVLGRSVDPNAAPYSGSWWETFCAADRVATNRCCLSECMHR